MMGVGCLERTVIEGRRARTAGASVGAQAKQIGGRAIEVFLLAIDHAGLRAIRPGPRSANSASVRSGICLRTRAWASSRCQAKIEQDASHALAFELVGAAAVRGKAGGVERLIDRLCRRRVKSPGIHELDDGAERRRAATAGPAIATTEATNAASSVADGGWLPVGMAETVEQSLAGVHVGDS